MDLKHFDPYRAIGSSLASATHATRSRQEQDDTWRPVMEAFHTADDMVLRYELAGVAPDDIHVQVDGRELWVYGERRAPEVVAPELSMRAERTYGRFDGSIALPQGTDPAAVRGVVPTRRARDPDRARTTSRAARHHSRSRRSGRGADRGARDLIAQASAVKQRSTKSHVPSTRCNSSRYRPVLRTTTSPPTAV